MYVIPLVRSKLLGSIRGSSTFCSYLSLIRDDDRRLPAMLRIANRLIAEGGTHAPGHDDNTPGIVSQRACCRHNALVQLQARYNHCGEAASKKCLSPATFVRRHARLRVGTVKGRE